MKKIFLGGLALSLLPFSPLHAGEDLMAQAREQFQVIPSAPPALDGNTVTRNRLALGARLFFDPRLSASHLISCNTCHNVGMGGDDNLETSLGHGWARGPRNAPTALNAVFNIDQFWDGRAKTLKDQAKGPVQAGVEMNNTPDRVVKTLLSMPGYVEQFTAAFPGEPSPVNFDNMAKAIEVFEATLTTPGSRFDQYLEGDVNALDQNEKEGLSLFMEKGCSSCHDGVNIGGGSYFKFGVVNKPAADLLPGGDKGRSVVTKDSADDYVFRTAPLRNVELTAPYFHSGKVWDLERAVVVMGESQLGERLTGSQAKAITAFLKTLTGEQPNVTYPVLPPSTPWTPQPITAR